MRDVRFQKEYEDLIELEELDRILKEDIELELSNVEMLKEDMDLIGDPGNVVKIIEGVVWEQFMNQIGFQSGEDFIEENNNLGLDLSKDAHIQTTENFAKGKIAKHNTKINYQERYDNYNERFQRDEQGNVKMQWDNRSKSEKEVLKKSARTEFDKKRDKGSASVHKDHTIPTAEINRDIAANAHMSREEQTSFANSDKNLHDLDAAANQSKSDSSMREWLNSERNGKTPDERYNIDKEELLERDRKAREEYEKRKQEGMESSIEAGKQSRKEEAFRISGNALRTAVMTIFSEFMREIMRKLTAWFMSSKKSLKTLLESLKEAVHSFVINLKTHIVNAGKTVVTTIVTSIFQPIVRLFKSLWTTLKTGWKALKDAIRYLTDPKNQHHPLEVKLLEVGKIVVSGLGAINAIVLSETIEKGLMTVPFLALEIPLLGSLANLLGIFLGGVSSGIVSAIIINKIDQFSKNKQKESNLMQQIDKKNEVLELQGVHHFVAKERIQETKILSSSIIEERHALAHIETESSLKDIFSNQESITTLADENDSLNQELSDMLKKLSE